MLLYNNLVLIYNIWIWLSKCRVAQNVCSVRSKWFIQNINNKSLLKEYMIDLELGLPMVKKACDLTVLK